MTPSPAHETLAHTRFWLKVWPRGDCWEWRGRRVWKEGYGIVGRYGQQWRAHRVAFEMAKGLILAGLQIDHLCNHPWCVKPSHLVLATSRENTLRGSGPSAQHARQTHCKHGHELTKANIVWEPPNRRKCRECRKAVYARYDATRRARGL